MQIYRMETIMNENHSIVLKSLPFKTGEALEIIILPKEPMTVSENRYPLRGIPITYIDPFDSVAQTDWESLQ